MRDISLLVTCGGSASEDGAADLSKADISLLAVLEPELKDALIAVQSVA